MYVCMYVHVLCVCVNLNVWNECFNPLQFLIVRIFQYVGQLLLTQILVMEISER